jgi:hypothetical protein
VGLQGLDLQASTSCLGLPVRGAHWRRTSCERSATRVRALQVPEGG